MNLLAGLSGVQKYVGIGMAVALAASLASTALMTKLYIGAKADIQAEIGKCNTAKAVAVAKAEEITRIAVEAAASERERQLRARIERESTATELERQKRVEAENRIADRDRELQELAEDAFDEDDLPDSNAALNVYLTSCALRSVLHAGNHSGTSAGGGDGLRVCADTGSPDGVHPGFSNVTYGDALRYWGQDRDTVKRLNGKLAEIRRIQGEIIDGDTE